MALTPKKQHFVERYCIHMNATQAAKEAGYSERTAYSQGERLLRNVEVASAIDAAMKERAKRNEITADMIVQELARVAFLDLSQAYDEHGRLLPLHFMPEDVRCSLSSVESFEERDSEGNVIGHTRKLKANDKLRALELLGKHLGMFETKVKVGGYADNPIRVLIEEIQGNTLKPAIRACRGGAHRADAQSCGENEPTEVRSDVRQDHSCRLEHSRQ